MEHPLISNPSTNSSPRLSLILFTRARCSQSIFSLHFEITHNIPSNQKILDFEKLRKQIGNLTILSAFKTDEWVLKELKEALE
ncbi:hypothetical protein M3O96_21335 [Aquiflexum sp. TKW24L]|uniref:hypothetical protein n=1 Tax=Aquiflexum sp. TKW24L TaxID=2942212 RepID=UPI0020BEE0E0|nr:hypothetical protein [Aquiflexum sp. TKW24L]MCL6261653.1 hypothetical protein [Aquiflexum sp. TKW24L]